MVLTAAVLCIGFSFGAEGDIAAYIVSRKFPVAVYSSVMGLVTMAMSAASATGATLLSITLDATGGFNLYLVICAVSVFTGGNVVVSSGGVLDDATLSGGTVNVQPGADANGGTIRFTSDGGALLLGDAESFSGRIQGFNLKDTNKIDLVDFEFKGATTIDFVEAGDNTSGTLTVTGSPHTSDLHDEPWENVPNPVLLAEQQCWLMRPGARWHGFTHLADGYVMTDPNKLTLVTPGFDREAF